MTVERGAAGDRPAAGDWQLSEVEATGKSAVVRTGPSGMALGRSQKGEVFLRLFRPQGTRVFLATPEYATWLVAFRAVSLGAHLTIVAPDHRPWRALADAIVRCGGTVDLMLSMDKVPGQGRPYRPSLVLVDSSDPDAGHAAGPWQTVAVVGELSGAAAVPMLRNCDLALFGSLDSKALDNVRRAYVLSAPQVKLAGSLGPSDVVLALPRRLTRMAMPPAQQEYRLLFQR